MTGKLELIIGPMFASKSTELIRIANRYKSISKNVIMINHVFNNRYNTTDVSTHDNVIFSNCYNLEYLSDFIKKYPQIYANCDIICIEELQFFNDAFDFVVNAIDNDNKTIIAAGLSGTYKREPFGDILKLVPYADNVIFLSALCKFCGDGTEAHFTKRISKEIMNGNIDIGTNDKFEAVCHYHYHN